MTVLLKKPALDIRKELERAQTVNPLLDPEKPDGLPRKDMANTWTGAQTFTPSASATPADNGQLVIEATSNTTLTVKYKGTDGTVRSTTLTLS